MAKSENRDLVTVSQDLDFGERSVPGNKRGAKVGRGRGGGGGNQNRNGSQGGSGRVENREVMVSKALSKLLRHAAEDVGLALDAEGFARVDQVMQWQRLKSLNVTFEDIYTAVTDNAKQRFSMKPNPALPAPPDPKSKEPSNWVIRANQGHSIAVDSAALLIPITLEAGNVPEIVVHGTYYAFYQAILESGGLKKMSRNHIHFSTGLPEENQGVISGMRADAELLIYVDIQQSLEDGEVLWWISENGVVLTEGDGNGFLATKYWKKVIGRKEEVGVLWENGEQVADLPQSMRKRKPPNGKGPHGKRENEKSRGKGGNRGGKGRGTGMKELDALGGKDGLGMN